MEFCRGRGKNAVSDVVENRRGHFATSQQSLDGKRIIASAHTDDAIHTTALPLGSYVDQPVFFVRAAPNNQ